MSQHEFPGLNKPVTAEQRAAYDLVKERDGLRERAEKAEAERDDSERLRAALLTEIDQQVGELERLKEGIRASNTALGRSHSVALEEAIRLLEDESYPGLATSVREVAARNDDAERCREGLREAASLIDRGLRIRSEQVLRDTSSIAAALHGEAESWLAAYCPIPSDRAVLHGEEETKP